MRAKIEEGCISCGLCESICPEVFRMGDDGLAEVYVNPVPESAKDSAAEARDSCPVSVIILE
ncbi:MAG: ferredoxin [Clostridiales bacterium]|jgi:ferredoxin|nr:ferredoxin [Clostridiales bacterium]